MNRRAVLMLVSMNPQISAAAIIAAALALNFSRPSTALAWFDQGHMTIAANPRCNRADMTGAFPIHLLPDSCKNF